MKSVALDSTRTIEIDEFVPRDEIDELYSIRPYYIAPDGKVGDDAFVVIRNAIEQMKMVAIGRVVLTSREHVIAIAPRGKGLMGTLLRFPYEVRDAGEYFDDIPNVKLTKDMMDLARHIVETKAGHFKPQEFEDHYEHALKELIEKKAKGEKIEAPKHEPSGKVINLMDALRRSVQAETAAARLPRARRPKRDARRSRARKKCCCRLPAKSRRAKPRAKSSANRRGRTAGSARPAKRLVMPAHSRSGTASLARTMSRASTSSFFRESKKSWMAGKRVPAMTVGWMPSRRQFRNFGSSGSGCAAGGAAFSAECRLRLEAQAFLDLDLRPQLRQHLFDQMTRKGQARVARALVRGRADELFDLGANGLLETLQIGVRPMQDQVGGHEPDKMEQRGERSRSGFRKRSADLLDRSSWRIAGRRSGALVEASLSRESVVVLPRSVMTVF